jgi:hypothetical protein
MPVIIGNKMLKTQRKYWAIVVEPKGRKMFAEASGRSCVPQRFFTLLSDSEQLAKRAIELGDYYPSVAARVVPVVVTVEEVEKHEGPSHAAEEE